MRERAMHNQLQAKALNNIYLYNWINLEQDLVI